MEKEKLKELVIKEIEAKREELIRIGRALYGMPETGFKEYKTSAYIKNILTDLGLEVQDKIALTGMKARLTGKNHLLNVGIMGELDSLVMPSHAHADPATGAAHACGHHAQIVCVIGVALGLLGTGTMDHLDGDVTLVAVPAEEVVELSFRESLAKEGKIKYFGGKQEFIRLGAAEDLDIILCSHITSGEKPCFFDHSKSYNGVIHKIAHFKGKSAHAALSPHLGINALHAAVCAINNINALRETLEDKQNVRIHYIITKGGDSPNIIPDDVRMELGVRASTPEMMLKVNKKVNRALHAGADALGAMVEIKDFGAYLPLHQSRPLGLLYAENAKRIAGEENVIDLIDLVRGSSTDAGDLASVKPVIHPNFSGAAGSAHTTDFDIADEYMAYVQPAKVAAMTVIDLLYDGAKEGRRIAESFVPTFRSKEEYCAFMDRLQEE